MYAALSEFIRHSNNYVLHERRQGLGTLHDKVIIQISYMTDDLFQHGGGKIVRQWLGVMAGGHVNHLTKIKT